MTFRLIKNETLKFNKEKNDWYLGRRKITQIYLRKPVQDLVDSRESEIKLLDDGYTVYHRCDKIPNDFEMTFKELPAIKGDGRYWSDVYKDLEDYLKTDDIYNSNNNYLVQDRLYLYAETDKFVKTGNVSFSNGIRNYTDAFVKYKNEEYSIELGNKTLTFWCYHVSKEQNNRAQQIQDFQRTLSDKHIHMSETDVVTLFEALYDNNDIDFKIVDNRIPDNEVFMNKL